LLSSRIPATLDYFTACQTSDYGVLTFDQCSMMVQVSAS
jgi:hypothetical protein